jgi:hypothetical protein
MILNLFFVERTRYGSLLPGCRAPPTRCTIARSVSRSRLQNRFTNSVTQTQIHNLRSRTPRSYSRSRSEPENVKNQNKKFIYSTQIQLKVKSQVKSKNLNMSRTNTRTSNINSRSIISSRSLFSKLCCYLASACSQSLIRDNLSTGARVRLPHQSSSNLSLKLKANSEEIV